jgi:hypothetical protein
LGDSILLAIRNTLQCIFRLAGANAPLLSCAAGNTLLNNETEFRERITRDKNPDFLEDLEWITFSIREATPRISQYLVEAGGKYVFPQMVRIVSISSGYLKLTRFNV